jgi:hypothetical protein
MLDFTIQETDYRHNPDVILLISLLAKQLQLKEAHDNARQVYTKN